MRYNPEVLMKLWVIELLCDLGIIESQDGETALWQNCYNDICDKCPMGQDAALRMRIFKIPSAKRYIVLFDSPIVLEYIKKSWPGYNGEHLRTLGFMYDTVDLVTFVKEAK